MDVLALGAYTAALFLEKTGNKDVRVYWKLFKRNTGGTETEILQSAASDHLTDSTSQYVLSGYLNEDQALDTTDRLVLKLYANVSGTGTDVTVKLTMEGDYDSRLTINILSSAFNLDRLSDVTISSPADDEALAYDSGSGKWVNQALTDSAAIHDNVAGEIAAITEKSVATGDDEIIINDSADANNPKSLKLKNVSGITTCRARVYLGTALAAKPSTWIRVPYDTVQFDAGSDFILTSVTGTADATEANKLHDADAGFTSDLVGAAVHNTTDDTYALVTGFVDSGELTLDADIMASGETYKVYASYFLVPEDGYYSARFAVALGPGADAGTDMHIRFLNYDGATVTQKSYAFVTGANTNGWIGWSSADLLYLTVGDKIYIDIMHTSGSAVNIAAGSKYTYLAISLESRP